MVFPGDGERCMKPNQKQTAHYIRAQAAELQQLAAQGRLETLAYLLEMVVLEADQLLKVANDRVR